jgi:hypothetical protein
MTPRRNWDRWLVLALSLASLWPFAGALLEGRVPGQKELPIDGGNGLFIFALVQDVLLGKADLLHTEAMWFPTGRPFLLVVQNVVDAVAAQPFLLLLGPAHGLAAFTAVALVANGLAAGWMGERIGGRGWSGPAAALVLALCPYIWAEAQVGRVTQALLFPICLAVGASWTAVESGRGAARAGGWLALAAAVYWFYGLFGAVVVAAVFLGGVVERPEAWRPRLGGLLVAALVSAAVVAPFALFNAASWSDMAGRGVEESPVPNATRIFGGLPWQQNPRIVAYVPQLLYGVGLLALLRAPRGRPLALVVVTFLLCFTAHGRPIELLGVSIPSPLAALQAVPGFERFWWPNRALAGAVVALAALAAMVVQQAGWVRNLAAVLLLGTAAQGAWPAERLVRAGEAALEGRDRPGRPAVPADAQPRGRQAALRAVDLAPAPSRERDGDVGRVPVAGGVARVGGGRSAHEHAAGHRAGQPAWSTRAVAGQVRRGPSGAPR